MLYPFLYYCLTCYCIVGVFYLFIIGFSPILHNGYIVPKLKWHITRPQEWWWQFLLSWLGAPIEFPFIVAVIIYGILNYKKIKKEIDKDSQEPLD